MYKWISLALAAMALVACSSDEVPKADTKITIVDQQPAEQAQNDVVELIVTLNTVNMREAPKMGSSVVAKLPANSKLQWQNQVSKITAPIKLRGVRYNDPWLFVKTADDKSGWVYAATVAVASKNNASSALRQDLLSRRVQSFFGAELYTAIAGYRKAYAEAKTSANFDNIYAYGQKLRDKLVDVLEKKAQADINPPADMSWLNLLLPGYSQSVVAEGTRFYLFADYEQFAQKAKQTEGSDDDQFFELQQMIYGGKQEGFFPAWIQQTWDYGGDNLLGTGIYKKVLDEAEKLLNTSTHFNESIDELKKRMLADLSSKDAKFSQPVEKRTEEIKAILDANYTLLSDDDKQQLKKLIKEALIKSGGIS